VKADTLKCGHISVTEDGHVLHASVRCPVCHQMQAVVRVDDSAQVSPVTNGTVPDRSYGCSWGCGNPYDYIIISVADGTTEFMCLVCYLKLAQDMIMAVLNPQDPAVKAAMADLGGIEKAPMTSGRVRKRGKNAPADIDDDDLISAFDSRIADDEGES